MREISRRFYRCTFALSASAMLSVGYFVGLLILARTALGEPRAELVARMETLRESITAEQSAADEAQTKSDEIKRQLSAIQLEVSKLKREEKELQGNLSKLEVTQFSAQKERAKLLDEYAKIKARLVERVRAVYLVPRTSALMSLVTIGRDQSFGLVNRYLEAVYQHDTALGKRLQDLATQITAQSKSLSALLSKQKSVAEDLRIRRERVVDRLAAQERVAAAAKSEQARREIAVAALRAKLLRFESTLTGLTGGSYEVTEGDSSSVSHVDDEFEGAGLSNGSRARLPVAGKIVTRFGAKRKDGQISKGFEIEASGRSPVKAVARARVAFVGELPGLGIVVVLDHGERMFSLYGRLETASCVTGDILDSGTVLGEAGLTKPLYFEIRQGGVAVDPRAFIALP